MKKFKDFYLEEDGEGMSTGPIVTASVLDQAGSTPYQNPQAAYGNWRPKGRKKKSRMFRRTLLKTRKK